MATIRLGRQALAAALVCAAAGSAGAAQPAAADILQFKPKQPGVAITTPTADEISGCKVDLVKGAKTASGKEPSAWVLRDAQGKMLRKFSDTDGDRQIDVYSYYLDGEECYREVDTNLDQKVDQFRWLGPNGSKWGVDSAQDGVIDAWTAISAEEVSQELLQAVIARDFKRLQALMITKAELAAFDLPEGEANRIKGKMAQAGAEFQKTTAALLKLGDKTRWLHLETKAPQTIPSDSLGAKADLTRYKSCTILYQDGEGKDARADGLQTGEMILVGRAWRIVEAPTPGAYTEEKNTTVGDASLVIPEGAKDLVEQLGQVDKTAPKPGGATPADIIKYNLARAAVLEKITQLAKPETRTVWLKQVGDCLAPRHRAATRGRWSGSASGGACWPRTPRAAT